MPSMRAGPALRDELAFDRHLSLGKLFRIGESLHPFRAVGCDDAKLETAGREVQDFTPHVTAVPLEPPEHDVSDPRFGVPSGGL